jgi:hypothetical protein
MTPSGPRDPDPATCFDAELGRDEAQSGALLAAVRGESEVARSPLFDGDHTRAVGP